jgi:predicted DCC family thiol-disulfide oxidoreductase YuxK
MPVDPHTRLQAAPLPGREANFLLYDGDCPVCSAYVAMSRLRQLYPDLRVASARDEPELVVALRQAGYEINEGMVLSLDRKLYFGAEATRMIAVLGRASSSRWRKVALASIGTAPWAQRAAPDHVTGRVDRCLYSGPLLEIRPAS